MRLLVLGGTAWLGRQVTADAMERGHDATCLARGESGPVPAGARFHRADRDRPDAFDELTAREWEAVIDLSRQPGQVRRATDALAERSAAYVFVSSGNVYAEHGIPGENETAELLAPLAGDVMETMETYGEAKGRLRAARAPRFRG